MAKVRVHELAKELGITSKDAVTKLQELGEFVRSASSTIEAPVVKKLRDAYRQLAVEEPERCVLIDAATPRDTVGKAIWDVVNKRFDPATAPLFVEGSAT